MANIFLNLPAPAGNGAGSVVDTSTMGKTRTITVQGTFQGTVNIEFSNESNTGPWAQALSFQNPGKQTISIAAQFMRVVRSGVPTVNPGTPNVDVGSNDAGGQFIDLPAPAGNGTGASTDVSALGNFNTIACLGTFTGTTIIEISEDGTDWAQAMIFTAPGFQSKTFVAQFMRVRRSGVGSPAGLPNVDVGAINEAASSDAAVATVEVIDTDAGNVARSLPPATIAGQTFVYFNEPSGDQNLILVSPDGTDQIGIYYLTAPYEIYPFKSATFVSNGQGKWIPTQTTEFNQFGTPSVPATSAPVNPQVHDSYFFDTTLSGVTFTLPLITERNYGRPIMVQMSKPGANNVTVNRNGANTIDGGAGPYVLTVDDQIVKFYSDGFNNWEVFEG